jgi:hypothetical protein
VSLVYTLTILGAGRPQVSRGTGLLVGAQYLVLAGAVHARQRLRELRAWCAASVLALDRRLRLMRRAIAQQGFLGWVISNIREHATADSWRKNL